MPEYKVESPLRHNGKDYPPGTNVTMEEAPALPLLDGGTIVALSAGRPNAKETIALVKAATDLAALEEMALGEERSSVVAAIAARRTELTPGAE